MAIPDYQKCMLPLLRVLSGTLGAITQNIDQKITQISSQSHTSSASVAPEAIKATLLIRRDQSKDSA